MAGRIRRSLPTGAADWRRLARTTRLVLGIPRYAALAALAGIASLSLFVWIRNPDLLVNVVLLGDLTLGARGSVLLGVYPWLGTAYTTAQSALLTATAVLVGVDATFVAYHVRENRLSFRDGSAGVTGVVLGTLGAGCAACGSALLAGLLSLLGAGGALTLLPLDGLEFAGLAVIALVLSLYWLAEGLRGGMIRGCPVDVAREKSEREGA